MQCVYNRVGTAAGCAMDFPALFSLVHILTARWQHCLAPKLKKDEARAASRFEVGSIREHTLRHLYMYILKTSTVYFPA
jgi:hypothetical protein